MHFEVGVVRPSISTPIRALRRQYLGLYGDFRTLRPTEDAIRIDVTRSALSLRHRRRYQVSVNGQLRFEPARFNEVVPYSRALPSPDGAYWRCKRPDGSPRCFFAPPPGS